MSGPAPESSGRLLGQVASVGVAVVVLTLLAHRPPREPDLVAPIPVVDAPTMAPPPVEEPTPAPVPPPPQLDRAAVARAEASLEAARRDRERAEARADSAAQRMAAATERSAVDAERGRQIALRVPDPSEALARAVERGGFLRAERDRLKDEVAALRNAPRPRAKVLADKNPVARPAGGDEYHFELRRNRITFIDLERLLTLVKSDAQLRIRLGDNNQRLIDSEVGPVGSFALHYTLGRNLPGSMEELMERRGLSFDLRGWELVPMFEGRGETYEAAVRPISEFSRAINRLNPARSTITMWIYPDGFALYRKLRDELHAHGYLVAARPLPEGMTIKGSPAGSLSAGQ